MKKILSLILASILCISMTACGEKENGTKNSDEEEKVSKSEGAFEISKKAYENIDLAYSITEQFGSDLYEAWRIGIYDSDELINTYGIGHLAKNLELNSDEILAGIRLFSGDNNLDEFDACDYFTYYEDDLFSFCVIVVEKAYEANGETGKAQSALESAKTQMKELSDKYSDYEHYPNLKKYFTTTSSYLEFCQNPTGSFEQVKETLNNYRNEIRDYQNDLDYIFEE